MKRLFADGRPVERRLVVSFSILSLGTGLSVSVLAVYLVRQLHTGPAAYGVVMSAAAACGMISGPVTGRLADRADARRVYTALVWTMALATGSLALADKWVAFALVCLLVMCGRGSAAVLGALVGREVPAGRRVRYRAVVKTASNATMLTGLGLGAIVLSFDSRPVFQASFLVEAFTLGIAGALIGTLPRGSEAPDEDGAARPARGNAPGHGHRVYRDHRFLALTAVNAFVLLYSSLLTVGLPLWIASRAPALLWLVPVVMALNIGGVLLTQVPVSKRIGDARAAVRAGARGTLLLAGGVAMFPLAGAVHTQAARAAALVVLAVLVACGEVLYSASSWELVYALAPREFLGEYQGVYNVGLDVSMLMAPALFAWLASGSQIPGWLAVAGVFLACALLIRPIVGKAAAGAASVPAQPATTSVGTVS